MANPASFTRSAARATSSAYRRLPIRWRLAGGSAVLTLVILLGFAAIIGVLTQRRIYSDFDHQVSTAADELQRSLRLVYNPAKDQLLCELPVCPIRNLNDYAAPQNAAVRIVTVSGDPVAKSDGAPDLGPPQSGRRDIEGFRVETRALPVGGIAAGGIYVQYIRKLSDVRATVGRVRLILLFGVLAGAALALLAGLAVARRAMAPIAELTDAARRISRTRDPSLHMPDQAATDEVAELADTLEEMLRSLDAARADTEGALTRQREFVADASHELRTPLTAVLANLELLEDELGGDQRDTASAALRSTRRMRRLVADLLLLARADAGREAPHVPVDLAEVLVDAAAELEPVSGAHQLSVSAERGAVVDGVRDELHRLALNLMDNALKHTAPGTPITASVQRSGDDVVLVVEDQGPGVPEEIAPRIFDRFVRGASDRGGSSGLGLSIVRAVAETHGGSVTLEPAPTGARFSVRLPAKARETDSATVVIRT
ncbi:MAG: two-component system, OmpR family, sensor kinase [Solirubrobacterales bacterium]|jgi:signal transduction histidine kinase|nr:two-component system, OmpR family, sensor kinase [Solirubrobacterales bacterium]